MNREDKERTFCSVSQRLPAYDALLLVLDDLEALCIESDLQLGEVDG